MHSKELGTLAKNRKFSKKAIIVPVDVFWGKSPERQDNLLKLFFQRIVGGNQFYKKCFQTSFQWQKCKNIFSQTSGGRGYFQ